jgi:hypothetical protein
MFWNLLTILDYHSVYHNHKCHSWCTITNLRADLHFYESRVLGQQMTVSGVSNVSSSRFKSDIVFSIYFTIILTAYSQYQSIVLLPFRNLVYLQASSTSHHKPWVFSCCYFLKTTNFCTHVD